MKSVTKLGLYLCLLLVLVTPLTVTSLPATAESLKAAAQNSYAAAVARWFNSTVDGYDIGEYASVAIDQRRNLTYATYYDETSQVLRFAYNAHNSGLCGPAKDKWECVSFVDGFDIGKYNAIAINPASGGSDGGSGGVGVSYHDATNGRLRYCSS